MNDLLESVNDFGDKLLEYLIDKLLEYLDKLLEYLIDKLDNDMKKLLVEKFISTNSYEFIQDVHDMLSEKIMSNVQFQ